MGSTRQARPPEVERDPVGVGTKPTTAGGLRSSLQIRKETNRPLTHVIPAVHVQNMPGDVAGHWGGEEKCGVDDFVRVAESA